MALLCRFKVLKECASYDSWQQAVAYHKEMNSHGMELPPSELIEFVEVSAATSSVWHQHSCRASGSLSGSHCIASWAGASVAWAFGNRDDQGGYEGIRCTIDCALMHAGSPSDGVHGL